MFRNNYAKSGMKNTADGNVDKVMSGKRNFNDKSKVNNSRYL